MRRVIVLFLSIAIGLMACGQKTEKDAVLMSDGSFEKEGLEAWSPEPVSPDFTYSLTQGGAQDGEKSLCLKNSKKGDEVVRFSRTIQGPLPALKYFKLSAYVRAAGEAGISLQPMSEGKPASRSMPPKESIPRDGAWYVVAAKVCIPQKADALKIICSVKGEGEAYFDNLSLSEIPYEYGIPARLAGPGLARAEGGENFQAGSDQDKLEVVFPLPNVTAFQTPVSYRVAVDPPEKLISSEVFLRSSVNWNGRVVLGPFKKDETIKLRYSSDVIMAAADWSAVPEKLAIAKAEDYPEDVRPWLKPTRSVQSDDPKIVEVAKTLAAKAGEGEAIAYIKEVMAFLKPIEFKEPRGCDALSMLEQGGACTSHANLGAALCRAAGIPARVIANYPTWNTDFQTHYIIEAYLPGLGWVPCETSMYFFPQASFKQIFVSIVEVQDELDSFDEFRQAAPGVPRWSLNEFDTRTGIQTIGIPFSQEYCDHIAYPTAQYPDKTDLADAVRRGARIWEAYLSAKTGASRNPDLVASLEKGLAEAPATPKKLDALLTQLEKLIAD